MVPELTITQVKRSRTEVYLHVLRALMLRDMRTRFGGSHIGYGVVVPSIGFKIDYLYVFLWAFGSFTLGMLLERFVVRKRA
jgi:hypothetical protein